MCLTEPQCGTDLGLIRTRAEPHGDGSYAITGTKIFISAGEHDLTENIVHLVLARLPDAPKGIKGISLFLVPKFLPKTDGRPGPRNGVAVRRHRAQDGHQGSATCVMNFERRDRLAGRRAAPRHARDVHDDERRAPRGRHAGSGRRRDRLSERRRLCPRAPAGPRALRREAARQAGRSDHRPPGRAAHAADHARRRPRARARSPTGSACRSIVRRSTRTPRRARRPTTWSR